IGGDADTRVPVDQRRIALRRRLRERPQRPHRQHHGHGEPVQRDRNPAVAAGRVHPPHNDQPYATISMDVMQSPDVTFPPPGRSRPSSTGYGGEGWDEGGTQM